ncbi:hypothetical protein [Dulcicalothrix desertica]|nr:hypothetical protein [Dulcicalothrix desertica]
MSTGYPSVPGVIGNGMNVAKLITRESVRKIKDVPKSLVAPHL